MIRIATMLAAVTLSATTALAQATMPAPSTTPSKTPPAAAAPAPADSPSVVVKDTAAAPMLTDEQAKSWVDKKIYSSDEKNMGEVAAFQRDSSGKVTELHADIGGFLGIGETRVRVPADKIKLESDRVVVQMTAEQMKTLPQLKK